MSNLLQAYSVLKELVRLKDIKERMEKFHEHRNIARHERDEQEYSACKEAAWRAARDLLKLVEQQAHWLPIEHAPKDGTEVLLTTFYNDQYQETDFGMWGVIERRSFEEGGGEIFGWSSNYGRIEEPTHFMYVASPT